MSKLNLLINLNAYQDANATITPSQNNFKWQRDIQGINISEPTSQALSLPSGQSVNLFSGSVSTSADVTTAWELVLKPGTSQTYILRHIDNTSPNFRTPRTSGVDSSTVIQITKNAKLLTLSSLSGANLDLITGGVVVGDEVRLGSVFAPQNQGKFKVISRTSTALTIENEAGIAQASVALGSLATDQLSIFSAAGVQVGDKLDIIAQFSSVSFGTYEITDVSPRYVEFYSIEAIPEETNIGNDPSAISIYRNAKAFVYIESDKSLEVKIDDSATPNHIEPLKVGTSLLPGMFMSSSSMKSLQITNKSLETATIFYVTAE